MAEITYSNKNKSAVIGTPERTWRDEDANEVKTVVNTNATALNTKISSLIEDTTPQLGGNLDLNGNQIGDASNADLTKLSELSATSTELNYVDGVTSSIQNQLNSKIESVIDDTSPQLGGDLDVNGNDITGNPSIDGKRAIVEITTTRSLLLTDAGKFLLCTSGSSTTVTIPTSASVAFPTETEIDLLQKGAGELTIAGGTGVTLNGVSAGSTTITAQWGGATIKKIATDEWIIVGKINDVA